MCKLMYKDTSICFVNSHLAAHLRKWRDRNDNYQEIIGGTRITNPWLDVRTQVRAAESLYLFSLTLAPDHPYHLPSTLCFAHSSTMSSGWAISTTAVT